MRFCQSFDYFPFDEIIENPQLFGRYSVSVRPCIERFLVKMRGEVKVMEDEVIANKTSLS